MSGFAQQLRILRKERGLTQAELAKALGMAQTSVANYEQGTRFPDEAVLNALADHFHVGIDVLLGRKPGTGISLGTGTAPLAPGAEATDFMDVLLGGDTTVQLAFLRTLRDHGRTLGDIYTLVLEPALKELGRLWESGMIDVYQEHRASADVERLMSSLMAMENPRKGNGRFLAFAVSGELHQLGLRMICDLMTLDGWETWFLGVNLPPSSILSAVSTFQPDVLGISASLPAHAGIAEQTIRFLRTSFMNTSRMKFPRIFLGGQAFGGDHALARRMGADALVVHAQDLPRLAREILERGPDFMEDEKA